MTTQHFSASARPRFYFGELAATLTTGKLVLPSDPDWADAAAAWNRAIPQAPAAVVIAGTSADVVATVKHALRHHIPISVQPGGHGATTALDGTILIRTGALDDIWIDADNAVARVGAGVKWGALQTALNGTGLAGPMGSSPDITVTGFCLGGGMSLFSRAIGVAANLVRAVEIIDGTGKHRWIDDDSAPELMWALRGGGGDFAVVTALEITLAPAPAISGGRIVFPASDAPAVWRAFAQVTATAPDALTLFASVLHFPPIPEIPEEIRGQSFCAIDAVYLGDLDALESAIAPIRHAGNVIRHTVRTLQPGDVGTVCEEPLDPAPAVTGVTSLNGLDERAIDTILDAAGTPACGLLQVQLRHLGGAMRTPSTRAACERIGAAYSLMALTMAPVPEAIGPANAAVNSLIGQVEEFHGGPLTVSMLGDADPLAAAFSPAVLERLRTAKAVADPARVFRSNRPVP